MFKFVRLLFFVFLLGILSSCEKEIHIDLTSKDKLVVIEGAIETNQQPYVYVRNSIGFFDQIDLNSVSYIRNAQITVTDITSNTSVTLKEYSIDTMVGNNHFSFNIYAPDVNDPVAMSFKGHINHIYKLNVASEGKYYESFTKIPSSSGLDSLWTERVPGLEDSFRILRAIYVDPDTFGNAVQIQTQVKRVIKTGDPEIFQTSFSPVYNDDIFNNARLPITIDMGYDKTKIYSQDELQRLTFLRRGDTVTVKWSAIDKQVYNFWQTLTYSQGSIGNPFSSPTKIQSNIPGALGVWAGYNAMFYTIVDTLK